MESWLRKIIDWAVPILLAAIFSWIVADHQESVRVRQEFAIFQAAVESTRQELGETQDEIREYLVENTRKIEYLRGRLDKDCGKVPDENN